MNFERWAFREMRGGFVAAAKASPLALLLLLPGAARAQDGGRSSDDYHLTGTLGFDYTNGDYGTARNTNVMLYLPSLSLQTGDLRFTASMPYMRISGRGLVIFDAAGNPIVVNRRTSLPAATRSGWGDLNLSATYSLPPSFLDDYAVKLTASTKLSTASARKRLSTGETDFGFSADISRQLGDWGPFLTVGYLIPGDPRAYQLYNTTSASIGTSYMISENLVAVASYDFDSASTPLVGDSHEVLGSLSWVRPDGITLTGYSTFGIGSGSPDVGFGLLVSYGFR